MQRPPRQRRHLSLGSFCDANHPPPACDTGLECVCGETAGAGRRMFGAPAASESMTCTCQTISSPPPSPPPSPPAIPPSAPPSAPIVPVVFDSYTNGMSGLIPAGGGVLDTTTTQKEDRVAFASQTISAPPFQPGDITGVRFQLSSGVRGAVGFTNNDPTGCASDTWCSSFHQWQSLAESDYPYTASNGDRFGFHFAADPATHGGSMWGMHGDTCGGCGSGHIVWSGSTMWEIRVRSDGKVDFVADGSVFKTSTRSVSSWPLYFGLSLSMATTHAGTDPVTSGAATNIQWICEEGCSL